MKTVKSSFTDKTLKDERITLVENNKAVSDESKLVEIFSKYFGNIVQNLGIDDLTNTSSDNGAVTIRQAIEKYQNHPSMKVIRENIDTTNNFSFALINPECMTKIINNLDTSKPTQQGDIPTKIIKDNKDPFSFFISASFHNAVSKGVFPNELKQADIKLIYKKESRNEIYQCGFRNGFSTQQCLLAMIEKLGKNLDRGGGGGVQLLFGLTSLKRLIVCRMTY